MRTDDYARAKGWHIWRQVDMAGQTLIETALCPVHAGNKPREKPVPIEGEQTLW